MNIDEYVKQLGKVLCQDDYHSLRKFIAKHGDYEAKWMMARMSDEALEIAFHKMRIERTDIPANLKKISAEWLKSHHYGADLYHYGDGREIHQDDFYWNDQSIKN